MALTVRSLGSGSTGNALVVNADGCLVVVDCGIGSRALSAGLQASGHRLEDVAAVLLTHEHVDHVRSLPQVLKAGVAVVATAGTARAAALPSGRVKTLRDGMSTAVGRIEVTALAVSHDAAEPSGFHLTSGGTAITVLTDLGRPDPALNDHLAASDLIVLEANHDEAMLRAGPYPSHLKRRVLSATGHLSNADCARMLADALSDASQFPTVWLAHLSTTNNRPSIARQTVQRSLAHHGLAPTIVPLPRSGHERVWTPGQDADVTRQLALPFG